MVIFVTLYVGKIIEFPSMQLNGAHNGPYIYKQPGLI